MQGGGGDDCEHHGRYRGQCSGHFMPTPLQGGVVSVRGTLGTRGHRLQRAVWQESVPHLPTSLPHSAVSGPSGSGSRRGSVGLTGVQACERGARPSQKCALSILGRFALTGLRLVRGPPVTQTVLRASRGD